MMMDEHRPDLKGKDSAQPEKICGSFTKADFPCFPEAQDDFWKNLFQQVAEWIFTTDGNLQRISDGVTDW